MRLPSSLFLIGSQPQATPANCRSSPPWVCESFAVKLPRNPEECLDGPRNSFCFSPCHSGIALRICGTARWPALSYRNSGLRSGLL